MERDELEQFIYRILATEDEEIDCQELFDVIAHYVDQEISGEDAARLLPLVHQHLQQCDGCAELHDTLHELAMLERQGALPEVDDLMDDILHTRQTPAARAGEGAWPAVPSDFSSSGAAERLVLPEDRAFGDREDRLGEVAPAWLGSKFNWGWAAAVAMLIVALVFGAWGWRQSSHLSEARDAVNFIANADRAVWMEGTEQDPDVKGFLFINRAQRQALLLVDGLNPVPSGRVYQMWMKRDSENESLGTFTVDTDQANSIPFYEFPQPAEFASLLITLEPEGGSDSPSSSPVCVWSKDSS